MVVDRYGATTAEFSKPVQGKNLPSAAASKSSSSTQVKQTAEDTTSFTSATNSVQALSKVASQSVPTRQSKVEALRQAVTSAQYKLDSAKIAHSIANSDV
jgi:flagellar biosynthesis anti-sigma factor FlgM